MPPPLELMDRHQKAVLIAATGRFDTYGEEIREVPIEIMVRWNDHRRQVLDRDRQPIAIDATIVVDRTIPEGSLMWKGTLSSFIGTDSDDPDVAVMKVVVVGDVKSLKGEHTRFTCHLAYHRSQERTNNEGQ